MRSAEGFQSGASKVSPFPFALLSFANLPFALSLSKGERRCLYFRYAPTATLPPNLHESSLAFSYDSNP